MIQLCVICVGGWGDRGEKATRIWAGLERSAAHLCSSLLSLHYGMVYDVVRRPRCERRKEGLIQSTHFHNDYITY